MVSSVVGDAIVFIVPLVYFINDNQSIKGRNCYKGSHFGTILSFVNLVLRFSFVLVCFIGLRFLISDLLLKEDFYFHTISVK